MTGCSAVEGGEACGLPVPCVGLCTKHYSRMLRLGTTVLPEKQFRGTTYAGIHNYLRLVHGSAREYTCAECGNQAHDWSYVGGCEDEQIETEPTRHGHAYCTHPEHYSPRCRKCHLRHDGTVPPTAGQPGADNHNAVFTRSEIARIRMLRSWGVPVTYLANKYGVAPRTISNITNRRTYKT